MSEDLENNKATGNIMGLKELQAQMKRDYERLRAAYSQLKKSHSDLQSEHSERAAQLVAAIEAKNTTEKECEALYKKFDEHLHKQSAEFQEMQEQMVPSRDLELLRVQIARELELPHTQREDALKREITKFRDMYLNERRQHELNRTKAEEVHNERIRRHADRESRSKRQIESLQKKNAHLQELVEDSKVDAQLSSLERENAQLIHRNKQLGEEMEVMRRRKQQVVLEGEQQSSNHLRALKAQESKVRELTKEKAAMNSQCQELKKEIEGLADTIATLQGQLTTAQQVSQNLDAELGNHTRKTSAMKTQLEARVTQLQQESTHREQQEQLVQRQLYERVNTLEREGDRLRQQVEFEKREKRSDLQRAKDEESKKLWQAEHEKKALREKIVDVSKTVEDQAEAHSAKLEAIKKELESAREATRSLTIDRNALTDRIARHEQDVIVLKQNFERRTREAQELENEYQMLQHTHRALLEHSHQDTTSKERLEVQVESLQSEVESLGRDMEDQRREHATLVTESQSVIGQERQLMSLRDGDAAKTSNQLKKEKNRYKKMAAALRSRLKTSEQHKRELMGHLETKTFELRTAQQQLREAERQRDELKVRMSISASSDPVVPTAIDGDFRTQKEIQALMSRLESVTQQKTNK